MNGELIIVISCPDLGAPNVVVTRMTLMCDEAPEPLSMDLTGIVPLMASKHTQMLDFSPSKAPSEIRKYFTELGGVGTSVMSDEDF